MNGPISLMEELDGRVPVADRQVLIDRQRDDLRDVGLLGQRQRQPQPC
jgi:hypothetical protein